MEAHVEKGKYESTELGVDGERSMEVVGLVGDVNLDGMEKIGKEECFYRELERKMVC